MRYIGLLPAPPELSSEITRGALVRLLTSPLQREIERTASNLLRVTIGAVHYGAIRSAYAGADDKQLWTVIPAARADGQEVKLWLR